MKQINDLLISNTFKNVNHEITLRQLLSKANQVEIICPFISEEGASWLIKNKSTGAKIKIITELSIKGTVSGVQNPFALEKLMNAGCEIYYFKSKLHAKVYWFDQVNCLITSANMTANGFENNLEVGFLVTPGILNESFTPGGVKSVNQNLRALFDFTIRQANSLTLEIVERYKAIREESAEARNKLKDLMEKYSESSSPDDYIPIQRNCINTQNLSSELMLTNLFNGFEDKNWDVFRHALVLSPENLSAFKKELTLRINPILNMFFKQLKNEPIFSKNYNNLEIGFSRNNLLTTRFPQDRYLFLTKPRAGKRSTRHLGEPSIIIGMGKSEGNTGWIEVRSGVEEDSLTTGLSEPGERLIRRILKNVDEVVTILNSLGKGWYLSHGSYTKGKDVKIDLKNINRSTLISQLSPYLQSREISDVQIRKKYYLNDAEDMKILLSPKITAIIAEDIERVSYFFDLAQ